MARAAATEQLRGLTAAYTGLRMGELLALRWRNVNFGARLLHVERNWVGNVEGTPKSHRRRSVPLSDQAVVALDALSRRAHFTAPDDLVFGNAVGEHCAADRVRHGFFAALEAAGLAHLRQPPDPLTLHDLRHTFGTQCAAKGIDLPRIQRWLGHADVHTTIIYLHHVPAHNDAARLTEAFTAARPEASQPLGAIDSHG